MYINVHRGYGSILLTYAQLNQWLLNDSQGTYEAKCQWVLEFKCPTQNGAEK